MSLAPDDIDFDLIDAKLAYGEKPNGITCDEPNDCDHVAHIAVDGSVECLYCGRPFRR